MGPVRSWTRDRRVWFFVATVIVLIVLDVILPPSIMLQTVVAVPVVASGLLGRPGFTAVLAGLGLFGMAISTLMNDYHAVR